MGIKEKKGRETGRKPTAAQLELAFRVLAMPQAMQRQHPSAVLADPALLGHINTYGWLPEFYVDRPFTCRNCGKTEIWKAADQKWYVEQAKGHIDAHAVECHDCRLAKQAR